MASKPISIHDYLIDHRGVDWETLLNDWTWLVPSRMTVWLMNRFGDLFVVMEDGGVWMLDVGGGSLEKVADSREDFGAKIDHRENVNDWLMVPLVDQLVAMGITLKEGECYSYKHPPTLGGKYTVENTCVLTIREHYGAYGSIHEQIRNVPDGAKVILKLKK